MKRIRRPTALDRELADTLLNLKFGIYKINVEDTSAPTRQHLGLAELKIEGSTIIRLDGKTIRIIPQ